MMPADMKSFRSFGKTVGTDINDTDIKCLKLDKTGTLRGAANCWPYEITARDY